MLPELSTKRTYFKVIKVILVEQCHQSYLHLKGMYVVKLGQEKSRETLNKTFVLFIPFCVSGSWSLLATKLRKYENIT